MNKPNASRLLLDNLDALEQELLAADDEEVLAAAAALGLDPDMKGSIALVGVTVLVPRKPRAGSNPAASASAPRRRRGVSSRPPKS